MNIIPFDIIGVICSNFVYIDTYNLLITCKRFNRFNLVESLICKSMLNSINKRLKLIFKENYNQFIEALKSDKAIISGSFLLQCIYEEDYKTDIDIYISTIDKEFRYLNPITETGRILYNMMLNHGIEDLNNILYEEIPGHYTGFDNITGIDNYYIYKSSKDKITVQLIFINTSEVKEFIYENFDFNFCKNLYYIDNNINLDIYNISNVLNKYSKYHITNKFGAIRRYVKYKNRGFTFDLDKYQVFNQLYPILVDLKYCIIMIELIKVKELRYKDKYYYEILRGDIERIHKICKYNHNIKLKDNKLVMINSYWCCRSYYNCIIKDIFDKEIQHLHGSTEYVHSAGKFIIIDTTKDKTLLDKILLD